MNNLITTGGLYINKTEDMPIRAEKDVYCTPRPEVELAYDFLLQREPTFQPKQILDLGAGEGVWGQVARSRWPQARIWGIELRNIPRPWGYDVWFVQDLRVLSLMFATGKFDLVVSNPPYYCDETATEVGMKLLNDGGFLMMLLELRFLVGQKRRDQLYSKYPLKYFGAYSKRISWTDNGKTPPRDHGLFVWSPTHSGPFQGFFLENPKPNNTGHPVVAQHSRKAESQHSVSAQCRPVETVEWPTPASVAPAD